MSIEPDLSVARALDSPGKRAQVGGGGYGTAWQAYVDAGWMPIPLPRGAKSPPPSGYTGAAGLVGGTAQYSGWASRYPDGNLGLRLTDGLLGLDVDAYAGKNGGQTLRTLERRLGPLPATYVSTSRGDGVSGIRFFRVPAGLVWLSELVAKRDDACVMPLGLLRRVLTPAGAVWALTTPTGQRLTGTVAARSLRFLESALMGGTDLMMVVLGKCGRIGRWAAGAVGNASAEVVMTLDRVTDKLRSTVGPWVTPNRLPVRLVNAGAGLVFLRQLSGLLPPVLRVPVMVLAVAITVGRAGRTGLARGLSGFAEFLAEAAGVTNAIAGAMAGEGAVRMDVKPTRNTSRITVEVPDPADAGLPAEASKDGDPAVAGGTGTGSRPPRTNAPKAAEAKRLGAAGGRH